MAISPSAIEKYNLCQRRYFWNYIMKDWEPQTQTPAALAGIAVHKFLETGDLSTLGGYDIPRLGDRMRNYIPEALTDVRKEYKFRETVEGVEFSGIVDLLSAEYIVDFKTTGSDAKYAKTDRKLLNDVQRLLYSAAFPGVPKSRWITGLWRDYSVVIGARENVPEDRERFRLQVLQPATAMLAMHEGQDPLSFELPGKADKYTGLTKACTAFGKTCPYVDRCFPKKRLTLKLSPIVDKTESKRTETAAALAELVKEAEGLGMYPLPGAIAEDLRLGADLLARSGPREITRLTEEFGGYKKEMSAKYLIENLYIDCMPIVAYPPGESLEYSYEYIAAAGAEVSSDMGVASPMLVDFGKGPHLVTAQLIANLSDRSEPIKHLFLETRSAEGRACMQELTSRAKFVVKGCY